MSEIKHCDICGCDLKDNKTFEFDGEFLCSDCLEEHTSICDSCGDRIWNDNDCGDENTCLCKSCFDDYYVRCTDCDCVINNDYAYYLDEDEDCPYCQRCYNRHPCSLHYYSYKPTPIFYGNDKRYIGVELEIDGGGQDSENAKKILNIVNTKNELIYIKTDGSLDDGMEIVTHPMTLDYHRFEMPWGELSDEAVTLGYLSHKISTCGLHCHVNRNAHIHTLTMILPIPRKGIFIASALENGQVPRAFLFLNTERNINSGFVRNSDIVDYRDSYIVLFINCLLIIYLRSLNSVCSQLSANQ